MIDVFGKVAFFYVSVIPFLAMRFFIAAVVLFLINRKTVVSELKTAPPKHYILPALCLSLSIIISNVAIRLTEATSYSFVRSLSAVIVPVLLCIFFKKKYTVSDLILQTVLVISLYMLCVKGGMSGFGIGEVLAFLSALLVSISLVWGADSVNYVSSATLTTVQMGLGVVCVVVYGLCCGSFVNCDYSNFLMPKVIFILLFNALVGTVVGYSIQNIALKHISSKSVGILQSGYPVATFITAHIMLGENLNAMGIIGAILIILCLIFQGIKGQ